MEGLLQGLSGKKAEPSKVSFKDLCKANEEQKAKAKKAFPRDMKEIKKRVLDHKYQDIVSSCYRLKLLPFFKLISLKEKITRRCKKPKLK